jgi:arginine decarboxylase
MMIKKPSFYFISAGTAEGFSPLNAFDNALLAAGVGDTNLVRLSSILPPQVERVEPFPLPYGALVPVAYAQMGSSTPGEIISAAVAIAIPADPQYPGLIMEHHDAAPLEEVEAQVREMARQGMLHRGRELGQIVSTGSEHVVKEHGSAFACVVLWDELP